MFMDKHTYIVDKLESNLVICENAEGDFINISINHINGIPKEGDVLILADNKYSIDLTLTKIRTKEIKDNMKGMWEE